MGTRRQKRPGGSAGRGRAKAAVMRPCHRPRVERPARGRGSYVRHPKHRGREPLAW